MIKKIYALCALVFISATAFGMDEVNPITELNAQLVHLQAQIKAVKLSEKRSEKTLEDAQKLSSSIDLFHRTQSDAKDLLAREEVITKMDELINQQTNDIINNKMPYQT